MARYRVCEYVDTGSFELYHCPRNGSNDKTCPAPRDCHSSAILFPSKDEADLYLYRKGLDEIIKESAVKA